MKAFLRLGPLVLLLFFACSRNTILKSAQQEKTPLYYEIDLNDRHDDLFKVKLHVDDLKQENNIYQFAATAPGAYQVMDIGRFVSDFQAFDKNGAALPTRQISTNQWVLESAPEVRKITYSVAETWDTAVDSNQIMPMCGTSIEDDHVQLNSHCVLGYPAGMQDRSLGLKLHYPADWKIGTALSADSAGYYQASDYDHMVDSPFLIGRLSYSSLQIATAQVDIYTYSSSDTIGSQQILERVEDILYAASDFMNGLPVDRYTFLFHFEDERPGGAGAWEHSYSSTYSFPETGFNQLLENSLPGVIAHEFFHVLTPLNIHSEVIEHFDFKEPSPSKHLWLYEGVTEWAAQIMMLRAGLIDFDRYAQILSRKHRIDDFFDKTYSLKKLAETSYSPEGQQQYVNIYHRGALIAGLLDIRLLELSGGKRGLQEVMNELALKFGPKNAFSEERFFEVFVELTYPEISDFFERFVKNSEPLPTMDYYGKLGIVYEEVVYEQEEEPAFGMRFRLTDKGIRLYNIAPEVYHLGVRNGDIIVSANGETVEGFGSFQSAFTKLQGLAAGETYEMTVSRNGSEKKLQLHRVMLPKTQRHVFSLQDEASSPVLALRESWQKNRDIGAVE